MSNIKLFGTDEYIKFKESTHQYFDPNNIEYQSVSRVLKKYVEPFDAKKVSFIMSGGDKEKQEKLLSQWRTKADNSINHGNNIHNALENYSLGKISLIENENLLNFAKRLFSNFSDYYRIWPEVILHSKIHKIAGQTDLTMKRQGWQVKDHVIDFYDYKTNLEQGIRYDSIAWNKNPIKHYNRYLLNPLSHLEDCNYNKYALQLSSYAYMAEITYGIKVGKLMIIFIWVENGKYFYKFLPVPYMKLEVMAMFNDAINLKKL
jgi:hypothetical protein